jgi:alcohol dehydrogenase (NADP+)
MMSLKQVLLPSLATTALARNRRSLSQLHHPLRPLKSLTERPSIGFGTLNLNIDSKNTSAAVSFAIQEGYRHIDCAAAYRNEKFVGKGIADGLKRVGLERDEIWVTLKLWNDQ